MNWGRILRKKYNLKELGLNWSRHFTCKLLRSLILIISVAYFVGRLLYSYFGGCYLLLFCDIIRWILGSPFERVTKEPVTCARPWARPETHCFSSANSYLSSTKSWGFFCLETDHSGGEQCHLEVCHFSSLSHSEITEFQNFFSNSPQFHVSSWAQLVNFFHGCHFISPPNLFRRGGFIQKHTKSAGVDSCCRLHKAEGARRLDSRSDSATV